jgi:anti-sigma factor ChrR (cupin superfamily)
MGHERLTDELREQAALYALGALEAEQARAFESHLRSGCSTCQSELEAFRQTVSLLPLSLPEHRPHPPTRQALLARIRSEPQTPDGPQVWKAWQASPQAGLHVVRAQQGEWQVVSEGVSAKQLYVDPARDIVTMLIRMAAGTEYPAHRHGGPEQCLVVEGDLRVGDVVLHAGDYQCASRDSIHDITRTENGCLLLIVSSQHDQLLA